MSAVHKHETSPTDTTPGESAHVFQSLNEREQQIQADYEWCLREVEVRRLYGGQVVVAHQRRVWGAGKNHALAWQAAQGQPGCPERWLMAFVVVPEATFSTEVQSTKRE